MTEPLPETPGSDSPEEVTGPDENGLTAGGRAAIDKMREETRKARDDLRPWKSLGAELKLTPDQIRDMAKGVKRDTQGNAVDLDAVRREITLEVTAAANATIARTRVERLAVDTFADPEDAVMYLDREGRFDNYEIDARGNLADAKSVQSDLADLLKRKPHLAKAKTEPPGPPDYDGGVRTSVTPADSMSDMLRKRINAKQHGGRT